MKNAPLFQFHKGTIRTAVQVETDFADSYFNSIKVQLELMEQIMILFFLAISIP